MTATTASTEPSQTAPVSAPRQWLPAALMLLGLWAWTITGCLDEWRDNPMYSYGWFVPPLVLFFAWRRFDEPIAGRELFGAPRLPTARTAIALTIAALALLVLPLELLRNELPDDRLNNWTLAAVAVGTTLWVAHWVGGWRLVVTLAFPIAFFFTAVAWPKRYESPVTVGLQKFVAAVIVEVMHVMGIIAEPRGTTIYLRNGPVGIAEACSGIRSLQASLMISLAIGELFYLRVGRRIALVALCAVAATILNLGRTLSLCLITEFRGSEAMDKVHNYIGDAILIVLPIVAWLLGRALATWGGSLPTAPLPRRPGPDGTPPPMPHWKRLWNQVRGLDWGRLPNLTPAVALGIAGFLTYHVWLVVLDFRDPPQQEPNFAVRVGAGTGIVKEDMNPDVWAALSPSSGGYYARPDLSGTFGRVGLYHFFWKPAAANRWVTGHRPDICMPAGGWRKDGEVEPLDVELGGRSLRMYVFRFADETSRALQLWGIWRNGEPIRMEFFDNPTLEWSLFTGKSRSAVEVLSCVVTYEGGPPPLDLARKVLAEAIEFPPKPTQPIPAEGDVVRASTGAAASPGARPAGSNPPAKP